MKKELILILALLFLAGCTQNIQQNEEPFVKWSSTFPTYYSEVENSFREITDSALNANDELICGDILNGELTMEKISAFHQCAALLTKQKAFLSKNYEDCQSLYGGEEDDTDYQECIAPIAAFISINSGDKGYCEENLKYQRLIHLCEDDYEAYN